MANLQIGIRKLVNREVYDEWQERWYKDRYFDADKIYELSQIKG